MHRVKIIMMRTTLGPATLVAFVGIGSLEAAAQQDTIPPDLLIKLERTSCFGACPVYSVTIDARGNVTYEGMRFVRVEGQQTDRIPTSTVATLLATANRVGFFDLLDSYRAPISDLPTTYVTITANGRTKRVEDYFRAPAGLKDLERAIDEAARTARWVRMDEQPAPRK